jgi:hypothetical protein
MGTNASVFNQAVFNGGAAPGPLNGDTLFNLANDALLDLGVLRPGQVATDDILAAILRAGNQMLSAWQLDELMVFATVANIFPLAIGQASFDAGQFTDSPTVIVAANLILNQFTPTVRKPLAILTVDGWANITVRDIAPSIPQALYYDKGYTSGTVNLWPAPDKAYQIELFAWGRLSQFADLVTVYSFPPGYGLLIRKALALMIAPMIQTFWKIKLSEPLLKLIAEQAQKARADVESYNAPAPELAGDPAFMGSRGGAWNYAVGDYGRSGR